jgi:hypothetical protein
VNAFRITLKWKLGQTQLSDSDRGLLQSAMVGRAEMRVVLAVYGGTAPAEAPERENYCSYVRDVLDEFPQINDVVIWNEPNLSAFWWPQFNADGTSAAPAAYEALLARCYDVLHRVRPDVNVIASTGPHKRIRGAIGPARWYRQLGAALRVSGRRRPICDTVGHNAYPDSPFEPPWTTHRGPSIDEGDYGTLMRVLRSAFVRTAQPLPGRRGVTIWYLEDGYQSTVEARRDAYHGRENVKELVDPGFAGWQLQAAVRLAYCQPTVGAFFNFQLRDDPSLVGWQSGVLYADGTPKPAYDLLKDALADVAAGTVTC